MTDPADVFIDEEKALKWLRRGAQPSDTAKRLLTQNGILMKFEYERLGKPIPGDEVAETDDLEPTETQDAASETDTSPEEATPEEERSEFAEEEAKSDEVASESAEKEE